MSAPVRSAREVVELYNFAVWNEKDIEMIGELVADQVTRHGVDDVVVLTREQARRRVETFWKTVAGVSFTLPVVVADDDGEHVAIVYQAEIEATDGTTSGVASIEVFRVVHGQIAEVWNNSHQVGHWR